MEETNGGLVDNKANDRVPTPSPVIVPARPAHGTNRFLGSLLSVVENQGCVRRVLSLRLPAQRSSAPELYWVFS